MGTPQNPMPKRVQVNTQPTAAQVNDYWKVLNLSQATWMQFSPAQRYETVLSDLLEKLRQSQAAMGELEDVE